MNAPDLFEGNPVKPFEAQLEMCKPIDESYFIVNKEDYDNSIKRESSLEEFELYKEKRLKTIFGNTKVIGDKILYFLNLKIENNQLVDHVEQILQREIPQLESKYVFSFFKDKIPVYIEQEIAVNYKFTLQKLKELGKL
jgi:hypothetical protein